MKKTFLFLFALIFVMKLSAQKKTNELSKLEIGQLTGKYHQVVDLENKDTVYYLYIGFQNAKYTSITDIKSIFFVKQENINEFTNDLKAALPEMGTKVKLSWDRELYGISLYDFSNDLYLREKPSKGNGHTIIKKKNVEKLITWLESIQFGTE